MRWPWNRADPESAVSGNSEPEPEPKSAPGSGAQPEVASTSAAAEPFTAVPPTPAPTRSDRGEWRGLAPLAPTASPEPAMSRMDFARTLSTKRTPPPIIQRLAHDRTPEAPAGIAVGVARSLEPARSDSFTAPPMRATAAPAAGTARPVQRQAGRSWWANSRTDAPAPPPGELSVASGTPAASMAETRPAEPVAQARESASPAGGSLAAPLTNTPATSTAESGGSALVGTPAATSLAALPSADLRYDTPAEMPTTTPTATPGALPAGIASHSANPSLTPSPAGFTSPAAANPLRASPSSAAVSSSTGAAGGIASPVAGSGKAPQPLQREASAALTAGRQLSVTTSPAASTPLSRMEIPLPRRLASGAASLSDASTSALLPVETARPTSSGGPVVATATSSISQPETASGLRESATGEVPPPAATPLKADPPTAVSPATPSGQPISFAAAGQPESPGVAPTPVQRSASGRHRGLGDPLPALPKRLRGSEAAQATASTGGGPSDSGSRGGPLARAQHTQATPTEPDSRLEPVETVVNQSPLPHLPVDTARPATDYSVAPSQSPTAVQRSTTQGAASAAPGRVGDNTPVVRETRGSAALIGDEALPTAQARPEAGMPVTRSIQRLARPAHEPGPAAATPPAPSTTAGGNLPPTGGRPTNMTTSPAPDWATGQRSFGGPEVMGAPLPRDEPQTFGVGAVSPPSVAAVPVVAGSPAELPHVSTRANLPDPASRSALPPSAGGVSVVQRSARATATAGSPPITGRGMRAASRPVGRADQVAWSGTTEPEGSALEPVGLPAPRYLSTAVQRLASTPAVDSAPAPQVAPAPAGSGESPVMHAQIAPAPAAAQGAAGTNHAELADQLYDHIAGRLRRDLLIERERSSLLLDR